MELFKNKRKLSFNFVFSIRKHSLNVSQCGPQITYNIPHDKKQLFYVEDLKFSEIGLSYIIGRK